MDREPVPVKAVMGTSLLGVNHANETERLID